MEFCLADICVLNALNHYQNTKALMLINFEQMTVKLLCMLKTPVPLCVPSLLIQIQIMA